jgi:hypothetical protein
MTDEAFLSMINQGQTVAAFLVAIGVAGLLLGDLVSRPINRRRDSARDTEIVQLRRESEAVKRDAVAAAERLALAEGRAAEAGRLAEQERLTRKKIQEKVAPRRLTRDQQASIANALRSYAGQKITLVAQAGDPESVSLTDDIVTALGQSGAGWDVFRFSATPASTPVSGILIETSSEVMEAARSLATALATETLDVTGPQLFAGVPGGGNRPFDSSTPIRVTIGRKP